MNEYDTKKAAEISRVFNCSPIGHSTIEELSKTHRTIQQNITRFALDWIRYIGTEYDPSFVDGRNEDSVQKCRDLMEIHEVKEVLDWGGIPFI